MRGLKLKVCPWCKGIKLVDAGPSAYGFKPEMVPCSFCVKSDADPKPQKRKVKAKSKKVKLQPDTNPELKLELPWVPSTNLYWRHVGHKVLISAAGRQYRKDIIALLKPKRIKCRTGLLSLRIVFYRPDERRRDIDNLEKAMYDALTHAGVYADDSLIWHVDKRFGSVVPGGLVKLRILPFVETEDGL